MTKTMYGMNRIHNKHGPDFDVGLPATGRPRDGTERKPRDGTEGMPRDGTIRKPRDKTLGMPRDGTLRKPRDKTLEMARDGTFRKPRDKTILWKGSFVNRLNGLSQDVRIHCRPSSKWRTPVWRKPAFGTGNGRTMPVRNYELRITNYE